MEDSQVAASKTSIVQHLSGDVHNEAQLPNPQYYFRNDQSPPVTTTVLGGRNPNLGMSLDRGLTN
jgi:hypothetical protein